MKDQIRIFGIDHAGRMTDGVTREKVKALLEALVARTRRLKAQQYVQVEAL